MAVQGLFSLDDVATEAPLFGLAKAFADDTPTTRDLTKAASSADDTLEIPAAPPAGAIIDL